MARQFVMSLTSKDVKKRKKYLVSEFPYTVNLQKQPNTKSTNHTKLTEIP